MTTIGYGNMGADTRIEAPTVKTTLDLSDDLLRRAKQAALDRNTTLRAIIEEALERALGSEPKRVPPLRTVVWPLPGPPQAASAHDALDAVELVRDERRGLAEHRARLAERIGLPDEPDES